MNGTTRNTIESTGSEWRKIGDDGRKIHSPDIIKIHSQRKWKKKRKNTRKKR